MLVVCYKIASFGTFDIKKRLSGLASLSLMTCIVVGPEVSFWQLASTASPWTYLEAS